MKQEILDLPTDSQMLEDIFSVTSILLLCSEHKKAEKLSQALGVVLMILVFALQ